MQRGVERWNGLERYRNTKQAVPHPHVVDKYWEGYLGSEGSQPQTRPPSPGFQYQEGKPPSRLAVKMSGGWDSRRNSRTLRSCLLKDPPTTNLGHTDPPPLGFSTRQTAGRVPAATEKYQETASSRAKLHRLGNSTGPSLSPHLHRATEW